LSNRLSVPADFVTPPLGIIPPDSKSSRTASNDLSQPEYCEDYPLVVARLDDGSRVIECNDGNSMGHSDALFGQSTVAQQVLLPLERGLVVLRTETTSARIAGVAGLVSIEFQPLTEGL